MENEEKTNIVPEIADVSTDTPPETVVTATVAAIASERELAELDAYKRHTEALKIELAEIRERFGDGDGESVADPLKDIRAEMAEMKSGFAEIKAMFEELKESKSGGNNNPPPVSNQPQSYYFPQPTPSMAPQFMPFYQTPNFQPIIPALPNFNQR